MKMSLVSLLLVSMSDNHPSRGGEIVMQARVRVIPIGDSDVSIVSVNSEMHPILAAWIQDPGNQRLRLYTVVLANNLAQPILGLTVRWIRADDTGNLTSGTVRSDSYLYTKTPVLDAYGQLLITPFGFQALKSATGGGIVSGRAGAISRLDELDRSSQVTIIFDTIIFQDGHVLGPDESKTLADLEARKTAGIDLVQRVRHAIANGEDVHTLLTSLSSRLPSWTSRFAQSLTGAPGLSDLEPQLDQLANLQDLPTFFRKQ